MSVFFLVGHLLGIQSAEDFVGFRLFIDKSQTLLRETLNASPNSFSNMSIIHLWHFINITDKCVLYSQTTSVLPHNNLLTICKATTPLLRLLYRHHIPGCHNLWMFTGSVFYVHTQLVTVCTSSSTCSVGLLFSS